MSAASRNLSEDELRITALCLALSSEAKLKIYNEPTLMLDNAQRDIFIGLAAREVSALFITTDDYFAANLKEALTFSL
jgi:energy-coupling factor transporter ATP-binding protein EcfA2